MSSATADRVTSEATPPVTIYTREQLAEQLGCHVRWVEEQSRAGRLPGYKIGRSWRFTEDDLATIRESLRPTTGVYTREQLAEQLGCHVRWVENHSRAGHLPGYKIGRSWRFTEDDLATIREALRRAAQTGEQAYPVIRDGEPTARGPRAVTS